MTADHETSPTGLPSLAGVPWLAAPSSRAVLAALRAAGHEGRFVGGAIRNTLLQLPVSDLDIATTASPDVVLEACAKAGLAAAPTGLDHGTVTVIAARTPIEVTTLRRDVATDGRHATIAFTEDWAEDAGRRDFTMNALYCDAEGRLYDFVDGYPDLVARRVRFIGDADERIAEDYLRILRFFRFHASYATGPLDPVALAACERGVFGVGRLSAERIRAELVKLLVAPRAVDAVRAMQEIGLLAAVLGGAPRIDVMADLVAAENAAGETGDAMLRLSGLAVATRADIPRIANRLRLSSRERKALLVVGQETVGALGAVDARRAREVVFREGTATARRLALTLATVAPERKDEALRLLETAATWRAPVFPVSGADLIARGLPPGPALGKLLAEIKDWWIAQDFPPRDTTLRHLEARAGPGAAN
ncbi:MAG: CCA tRNA nucleotidyltransferase [Hyphomicrobiaceae bacterium]